MDKRAKQVLFDAFWSTHGWKREVLRIPPGDFEYAKARRVMFEPLLATHDETIKRLSAVVSSVSLRQVVDGFLASLSTRRLDWRSALGSYSVAFWLPIHEATPDERQCRVCGLYSGKQEQDLNVLNFERLKWGGVRHSNPTYELLDLELFMEEPPSAPTVNDFEIFRSLICAIEKVPPSTTSAELHKWLPSELRSNKAERDQLIAILGLCGILDTPEHPGFGRQFVPHAGRTLPERRFVDMAYPACWWSGSLGLNRELLLERFGHAL